MSHLGGSASVEIDAPLEEVWAVDRGRAGGARVAGRPRDAMTALEHDEYGRATLVETENDIKVRRVKTQVRFRYDGPARLSWTQEKGDLKSVEGAGSSRTSAAAHAGDLPAGRGPGPRARTVIRGPVEAATRALLRQRTPRRAEATSGGRLEQRLPI